MALNRSPAKRHASGIGLRHWLDTRLRTAATRAKETSHQSPSPSPSFAHICQSVTLRRESHWDVTGLDWIPGRGTISSRHPGPSGPCQFRYAMFTPLPLTYTTRSWILRFFGTERGRMPRYSPACPTVCLPDRQCRARRMSWRSMYS